jgi:cation-dependent mannose-6-phosphate receptor
MPHYFNLYMKQANSRSSQDMTIILFASLGRVLRLDRSSRGGYVHANGARSSGLVSAIGGRRGRDSRGNVDAENRLIDQLDEEWED